MTAEEIRRALADTEVAVVVAADRRDEGLGERLMDAVVEHSDLQRVVGLSLLCRRGFVPFYGIVGFELYDGEVDVPEGGTEELVRMAYRMER